MPLVQKLSKRLTTLLASVFIVLFLFLSAKRMAYSGEIEWMEGSIIEHAERVYDGSQLYTAPSIEFVNWLYQPLYYYATAAVMEFTGVSYLAGRLVSFLSAIAVCILAAMIVRRYTKDWTRSLIAVGLIAASYHWTGYTFDIARIDALHILLVVAGVALLQKPTHIWIVAASALFFALAFFTKQQALFYLVPAVVWLFVTSKRSALVFVIAYCALIGLGTWFLTSVNGSWYWYYVYTVPASKAGSFRIIDALMFVPDYLGSAFTIGNVVIAAWLSLKRKQLRGLLTSFRGCLLLFYVASVIQLAMHLGDALSYKNVAVPYAVFFALVFTLAACDLFAEYQTREHITKALYGLVAAQFLIMGYNPLSEPLVFIKPWHEEVYREFIEEVRQIPGNVRLARHAYLPRLAGKQSYANELSLYDVSTVGDTTSKRLASDWERAHREGKFDYILTDAYLDAAIPNVPNYTFDRFVNLRKYPFASRMGDLPLTPRYLFRYDLNR